MGNQSTINPPGPPVNPLWITLVIALQALVAPAQSSPISATTVPLILPTAIVFDAAGNLYIAETGNHVIRKVDTLGQITTIAGTGTQGFSGDGTLATQSNLDSPQGLALTASTLYIADTHNHRIRKLDLTTNIITTIAGTGTPGYFGDNSQASSAVLNKPTALAVDSKENLYIADTANHRIRRIDAATGIITTVAGSGIQGYSGDSDSAISASIDSPSGIALDAAGNLYLADTHNQRIRRIDAATGIITTLAGTGTLGLSGDRASALSAQLALPHGLSIDAAGNLYLADTANHRIRRIDTATGTISTIVGTGTEGFSGDSGSALEAALDFPRATALSPIARLTIADTNNQRIRQLNSTLSTIAGLSNLTPATLTLTAPAAIAYGTSQLTATLTTAGTATGAITFLDLYGSTLNPLAISALLTTTVALPLDTLSAGIHNLTATYSGDSTHAAAQSAPFILTIAPAPTVTTLSAPDSTGLPLTLTAQVLSTTKGIATGNITILDTAASGAAIATATLTPTGRSTVVITSLTSGDHSLTVHYPGDTNFQPSTSAAVSFTIASTASADFALTTTSAASQTIASGGAATFNFNAQAQGALDSPITLSASGLPPGATATFSPTYIAPGGSSNAFTLTVATIKTTANSSSSNNLWIAISALLIPLAFRKKRSTRNQSYAFAALTFITLATTACGDRINTVNSQTASSTQTYTIAVTGTATSPTGAALIHTVNVRLIVQ